MKSSFTIALCTGLLVWPGATTAAAQDAPEVAERPLLMVGGGYGSPARANLLIGVLLPFGTLGRSGDIGGQLRAYRGLEIEANLGRGATRLALGLARRLKQPGGPVFFGEDLLVSVTRTGDAPRNASAASTYVGVEAGVTLVMVRFSAGAARRVAGASGARRNIFIWSAGIRTGW